MVVLVANSLVEKKNVRIRPADTQRQRPWGIEVAIMPRRHRSVSGGSYRDMATKSDDRLESAQKLFDAILQIRPHQSALFQTPLALSAALLQRASELDEIGDTKYAEKLTRMQELDSGYTPLHSAILRGDLAAVLLLLRQVGARNQRPLTVLSEFSSIRDNEGYTAMDLLEHMQEKELLLCRLKLLPRPKFRLGEAMESRRRRSSFDIQDDENDDQNVFDVLSRHMHVLRNEERQTASNATNYACEVLTFGSALHCAMGVAAESSSSHKLRPQRVQAFAQDTVGRNGSAVAAAASAHHTLVVNAEGHLYAFGLGKGGRLGIGDESHCPLPTRVLGQLSSRRVVAVAAAENHSLCTTKCGYVFAWGSNRFGQLGQSPTEDSTRNTPRRIDDLRNSFCVAVAAGERHSVALSRQGEVYVWGDNTSGQLGITRRNGTHRVQRVESLWGASPPKACVAVSAAEQTTMVLVAPTGSGLPVNSIYSWGHGSHIPCRVQFGAPSERTRPINPVAISSARHHNAAITSDGHVYTWGLHSDALGTPENKKKPTMSTLMASPQLVEGMLPEKGGGLAVAVSASENHTAVLTSTGTLYTWGATYGANILGHEGVRWQPNPKKVPGVHRAVSVVAAKEHTVLLMATSFPPLQPASQIPTLERLATEKVVEHVDVFNVIPVLMTSLRCDSTLLSSYCYDFICRNFDGVLEVGQKKVVNCYLDESLALSRLKRDYTRDDTTHPFHYDVLFPQTLESSDSRRVLSAMDFEDWLDECDLMASYDGVSKTMDLLLRSTDKAKPQLLNETRRDSQPASAPSSTAQCSDRCISLTSDMDLSTLALAEAKFSCLSKEAKWLSKRLSQIAKLEESRMEASLSSEQVEKLKRLPQLKADWNVIEPALKEVEQRIEALRKANEEDIGRTTPSAKSEKAVFRCDLCQITSTDEKNHTMHLNGRKHRNRVAQEEEKAKAATVANLQEERRKADFLKMDVDRTSTPTTASKTVWGTPGSKASPSTLPKYRLPPPPHDVPDVVVSEELSGMKSISLREIMKEETLKSSDSKAMAPLSTKKPQAITKNTPQAVKPAQPVHPVMLPPNTPPPMKAWSPAPHYTEAQPARRQRSQSLGDFLKPSTPKAPPQNRTTATPWSSPSGTHSVAFAQIQEEALAQKSVRNDPVVGKWYVQERARAGSFHNIQEETAKEREHQRLVAEQLMIEKQIQQDLQLSKKQQGQRARSKSTGQEQPTKRKPNRSRKARGAAKTATLT